MMNSKIINNQKNGNFNIRCHAQYEVLENIGVHSFFVEHEEQVAGIADCGNHLAFD